MYGSRTGLTITKGPSVVSLLGQRHRRWPNNETALDLACTLLSVSGMYQSVSSAVMTIISYCWPLNANSSNWLLEK